MQLISIMLITVAILTLLSGAVVFFGAYKVNRARSAWFFVSTIFAMIWTVAIVKFLGLESGEIDSAATWVNLTYLSSIFIDVAMLGYIIWRQKGGKALTLGFLVLGLTLAGVFLAKPELLYSEIVLSRSGNYLVSNLGTFFYVYVAFFGILVPLVLFSLFRQILKTTSRSQRIGSIVLLIGFAVSGVAILIFNLILTLWRWDLVWIGPLTLSVAIIGFYYSILRYRTLNLASRWLKILSYVVIMTSAAVIYMVIFFVIFAAMFRGSAPSSEVIILNFVMIVIVLLLMPVMNELNSFVQSLISTQKIDMLYIVKKLSKLTPQGVNLNELAAFLASHMHFEYIGFLVDGKVYGSEKMQIDDDGKKLVATMGEPEHGVWQEFDETDEAWQRLDLSAVAALRNANGVTFGQVMVGKPLGKISFSRRDLIQVETIINLVAVIIDSKNNKRG